MGVVGEVGRFPTSGIINFNNVFFPSIYIPFCMWKIKSILGLLTFSSTISLRWPSFVFFYKLCIVMTSVNHIKTIIKSKSGVKNSVGRILYLKPKNKHFRVVALFSVGVCVCFSLFYVWCVYKCLSQKSIIDRQSGAVQQILLL